MLFGAVENVRGIHLGLLIGEGKKVFVSHLPLYHEANFTKLKQTLLSGVACLVGGIWNCIFI